MLAELRKRLLGKETPGVSRRGFLRLGAASTATACCGTVPGAVAQTPPPQASLELFKKFELAREALRSNDLRRFCLQLQWRPVDIREVLRAIKDLKDPSVAQEVATLTSRFESFAAQIARISDLPSTGGDDEGCARDWIGVFHPEKIDKLSSFLTAMNRYKLAPGMTQLQIAQKLISTTPEQLLTEFKPQINQQLANAFEACANSLVQRGVTLPPALTREFTNSSAYVTSLESFGRFSSVNWRDAFLCETKKSLFLHIESTVAIANRRLHQLNYSGFHYPVRGVLENVQCAYDGDLSTALEKALELGFTQPTQRLMAHIKDAHSCFVLGEIRRLNLEQFGLSTEELKDLTTRLESRLDGLSDQVATPASLREVLFSETQAYCHQLPPSHPFHAHLETMRHEITNACTLTTGTYSLSHLALRLSQAARAGSTTCAFTFLKGLCVKIAWKHVGQSTYTELNRAESQAIFLNFFTLITLPRIIDQSSKITFMLTLAQNTSPHTIESALGAELTWVNVTPHDHGAQIFISSKDYLLACAASTTPRCFFQERELE